MNCVQWEERLALYTSGDLSTRDAADAERHLAECAGCQSFLSGLRESLEFLERVHSEEPQPAQLAAIRARVVSELAHQHRSFRRWVRSLGLVTAAILVILGVRPASPPPLPPPVVALAHPIPPPSIAPSAPTPKMMSRTAPGERVLVKVVSPDPNVVIYWIAETKGD